MKKTEIHAENIFRLSLQKAIQYILEFQNSQNTNCTVEELTKQLYLFWYTKSEIKKKFTPYPQKDWEQIFNTVHTGTYRWEKGWKVLRVSNAGRIIAKCHGEERILYPGDYISTARPGLLPSPGTEVEVTSRRTSTEEQPGFWISYSSTWFETSKDILRIYWNIIPEGAVLLIKQITKKIPDSISYSFKVPIDTIGYQRADTAVLYFGVRDFKKLQPILKSIYIKVKPFLSLETPGFAKILEAGMALAEDPMDKSESFGMHRCRLLAEGYKKAMEHYPNEVSKIEEMMQNYLSVEGINLKHPYLNKGNHDVYEW